MIAGKINGQAFQLSFGVLGRRLKTDSQDLKALLDEARAVVFNPVRLESYEAGTMDNELDAYLVINQLGTDGFQVEIDKAPAWENYQDRTY